MYALFRNNRLGLLLPIATLTMTSVVVIAALRSDSVGPQPVLMNVNAAQDSGEIAKGLSPADEQSLEVQKRLFRVLRQQRSPIAARAKSADSRTP